MTKLRTPFQGGPKTRQILDAREGLMFKLTPNELTPMTARAADGLATASAVGLAWLGFYVGPALLQDPPDWAWLAILFGAFFSYAVLKEAYRALFRMETRIEMTAARFSYRVWYGWKHFDRALPHKFVVIEHDKARLEQEKHALEMRTGRGRQELKTRYYGESFHIVFEYVGQRNDVLTVFGRNEALAVAARLRACDGVLDQQARMGDGLPLAPDKEWDDQPGDIK